MEIHTGLKVLPGLLLSLFTCAASASSLQDGIDAWRDHEREAAIAIWLPLANRGDSQAGLFLAYAYRNGLGTARDDENAARWYRFAAQQGHPEAQYELALMYELGLGVPQDTDEAARWYGLSGSQACPAELSAGGRLGDR